MPNARQSIVVKPVSQLAQFAQRLFQAPQDNIRDIEPNAWYSPLQPVKPMGPPDEEPKGFQFYAGQNLIWTPRPDAEYNAFELKGLATYPLARICIENVKDSISRIPWTCQLKPQPGETKKDIAARSKGNKDLLAMNRFFDKPDRENCWDDWLRPLIEDMLVIDAATILVRRTVSGVVAELRVLPGEMITRYIDENGYTPMPPDPAYAQIWWGVPLLNLTTDQLIYKPRNFVRRGTISSQLYGMSPTEQLAPEIIPGIKRLEFVTLYYTAGAIPDVVQVVPKGTPASQIAEAMQWMNSDLAGNLTERRKWRMVQGFAEDGKTDQILFPKEKLLADAFDEMHIRKICFGYGTSPQRLMRMMGTRNAAAQQEAAEVEGLIPWLEWIKNVRNHITQNVFGYTEIESSYDAEREPDPEKQAGRIKTLVSCGVMTINQGAEEIGNEPFKIAEADQPGIVTGTGFVPIAAEDKLAHQQILGTDAESVHQRGMESRAAASANKPKGDDDGPSKPTPAVSKPNGKPNGKAHTSGSTPVQRFGFGAVLDEPSVDAGVVGHASVTRTLEKEFNPDQERDDHGRWTSGGGSGDAKEDSPKKVELQGHEIETSISDFLMKYGFTIAEEDKKKIRKAFSAAHVVKPVINPAMLTPQSQLALRRFHLVMHNSLKEMEVKTVRELKKAFRKVRKSKADDLVNKIMSQLESEFDLMPDELEDLIEQSALGGVSLGAMQISITDKDMLDKINAVAGDWARRRAAELVGMRRTESGELIPNPNAKWAITDSTRDKLMIVIRDLFAEESPTMDVIEKRIMDAGIFSDMRASMIARTEISRAQSQGNLEAWKGSKKVATVEWQLSGNHDRDDECNDNADGSPYDVDQVPDCPAHPNCDCVLVLGDFAEEEGSDE